MDPNNKVDSFLQKYNSTELKVAEEFLSNWVPFLSRGLCSRCTQTLTHRIRSLQSESKVNGDASRALDGFSGLRLNDSAVEIYDGEHNNCNNMITNAENHSSGSWKDAVKETRSEVVSHASTGDTFSSSAFNGSTSLKMSSVDMDQEDDLGADLESELSSHMGKGNFSSMGRSDTKEDKLKTQLLKEQREQLRFRNIKRKKDFVCFERVDGKRVNVLEGLELHNGIFSAAEQKRIVNFVEELQEMGENGKLRERTYTTPRKWMKGKGRVTLQFGCCYNYAKDRKGNPPGILKNELVDPLPQLFKVMIKRLVRWHVLRPTCVPDSCIVNIYDEGDCIPPHIDNHEFVRPFCTVSFLSECNIVFGTILKIVDAGVFTGAFAIPLPVGSVLVLKGNGADVAKHCVPSVPTRRISITFRRMDESKRPVGFVPEPDLQGLRPLANDRPEPNKSMQSSPGSYSREPAVHRQDNGTRGKWPDRRSLEPRNSGPTQRAPMNWRKVI
ncbi:hypothetical protein LIER_35106 [Lithospermum erythrorhizon]|uniref:Fe2OG dioxygenase domain-containing protein n=1 Tax=Lithospermum erythrorhizon TaxID=34254 RepID=A0AAV3NKW2_LITER